MLLFYAAVRDLIYFSISDCAIIAKTYESAEKKLRKHYNKEFDYYEFELIEQDEKETKRYFETAPDGCKKAGLYGTAPLNYAWKIFV